MGEAIFERPPDPSRPELLTFKLAQYSALREEILKRLEMQHQLIALALLATGTLIPIGLADNGPVLVLLLSPILILLIAIAWAWNNVRIVQTGKFIKDKIEGKDDWEHYWRDPTLHNWPTRRVLTGAISALSIYLGAQLLIMVVAWFRSTPTAGEIVILVVDGITVALTFLIVYFSEDRSSFPENSHNRLL
jgi:hypothetical protein